MTDHLAHKLEQSLGLTRRGKRKPKGPPVKGPGRPNRYKLADGKVVPSCTTVLGRVKDSAGLIRWAYNQGIEGAPPPDEQRDRAGDTGHIVHARIQARLHGEEPPDDGFEDPEELARAATAEEAFAKWAAENEFAIVETETPMVSEKYRFGGTLDSVMWFQGRLYVGDWKSGNRIYVDHICQLAAYRQLLRERDGRRAPRDALCFRLDKETGEPHVREFPSEVLDIGWAYFKHAREIYRLDQDLKKVVK